MAYLYGTYGHVVDSVVSAAARSDTVAVYIGTAPINLVRGYSTAGLVNKPLYAANRAQALSLLGYSSDWDKFTLCEAIEAHFNNPMGNIGPLYFINVLDPTAHKATAQTTKSLTFSNGRASFASDTIILDTLTVGAYTENTDYTVSYDFNSGKVNIISVDPDDPITGTVSVTYYDVVPDAISGTDIIGAKTTGVSYTGLYALELIYETYGVIPNILAAPKWSEIPAVYTAMVGIMTKLNNHWDGVVYADLPISETAYTKVTPAGTENPVNEGWYEIVDGAYVPTADTTVSGSKEYYSAAVTATTTISAAVAWKAANGYISERSKVFWPRVKGTDGNVYHLSSLALVETLRVDASHDNVPMESCGNETIPVTRQYFGEGSTNAGFSQADSDGLTKYGIATAVYWALAWRIWGDNTAAYTYGDTSVDPRAYFDTTMRMLLYLTNGFQQRWAEAIDEPFTLRLKDTILTLEQENLNALKSRGALVGNPTIAFVEANNPETDMVLGYFRWDIECTPVMPLKAASAYVAYTSEGLSAYFE